MFCKNCGAQLPDEAQICSNCGTSLTATTEPSSVQSPEVPQHSAAPVATMTPVPTKKGNKGLIIGIAIAVIVALLAAGLWLARPLWDNDNDDEGEHTTSATLDPESSTPQTSTPQTSEPVEVNLVVNEAKLTYELTDADVDKFYDLLAQCKTMALEGQSPDAVMKVSDELDDQFDYMDTQLSIATVLYYCDLNDEDASQLYLDCTDLVTEASDAYMEMAKELYAAEFPAKERFFEEWTEQDLAMLQAYTSEIMQLRQRNSEITVAYQDLQDDSNMYTKMVPLYIEMVQNNNRMAQIYGYENYYEYAYEMVYDRDYGSKEVSAMRTLVARYMPDSIEGAMNAFYANMEELNYGQQYSLSVFLFNSYEGSYTDEIEAYLATLPPQARKDMLDMFDGNIVMCDDVSSAQEGAFTTDLGDNRCICFFGPGYSNPLTVIHEVGHYYGGMHTSISDLPLDLAEVQSQGNEWLFMSFMEGQMQAPLYNTVLDYKLYNDMAVIMISVIVDDFEEQVYTHPNIASLTSDDLDDIMEQVCVKYGGVEFIGEIATDIQSYWRMVVVEQPVYYISYGVSAIAAIDIYTVAEDDYAQAVEIYCDLIENVDLDEGFLGNLSNAKLDGPFDEDVYIRLHAMFQ